MNAKSPTNFQNGIIDVFKLNKVFDLNPVDCVKKGDVISEIDKEIGKKVIRISGNVSTGNSILIPNPKHSKSLNYFGRYYYILFKPYNDRKFSFTFTFNINNNSNFRFIFKSPLKELKVTRSNSYNIEIPIQIDANWKYKWMLYKFDPTEFINKFLSQNRDLAPFSGVSPENSVLKSFEAFTSITIKGVYISNATFSLYLMPKEIAFKATSGAFADMVHYFDLCYGEVKDIVIKKDEEEKVEKEEKIEINKTVRNFKESKKALNIQKLEPEGLKEDESIKDLSTALLKKKYDYGNQEYVDNQKETIMKLFKKDEHKKTPLLPDPIMHLNYILGFTAKNCGKVQFNTNAVLLPSRNFNTNTKDTSIKKHLFFSSGTTLVKYDPYNIKQSFFFGHSKPISNFLLACNGEIIFSNQEGANSIIRVWDSNTQRCKKMLTTPYDKIKVLAEDIHSHYLCTVGNEQRKESIILWDISDLNDINVYIRQTVPNPIEFMKFSPFDPSVLVSCGRENVKFWRIKNDHLSGKAVVLDKYAREVNFICMDFNNTLFGDELRTDKGKLYVGSSNGCVFQIACGSQELEAVYKVQDSKILSIAVNEAFCVTGSLDGYLRVWPVDFSEFLIEAKHDCGISSVDISYDAIEILCGTMNGSIGILNVQSKEYRTILRSPPTVVKKMIAHPNGNFLFTIEGDYSVRVWDVEKKLEAFQFVSKDDRPNCLAAPSALQFSCGFNSGILKIFDLEKTEILYECKSFQYPITNLQYIQRDKMLLSMSAQGNISIHDVGNKYIQVKMIKIDQPCIYTDLSLSVDGDYFATIGEESTCIYVWNAVSFGMKNRVTSNVSSIIMKMLLINKNLLAVILQEKCTVRFYSLCTYEGIFIKEISNMHLNNITQLLVSKNFKFLLSGGEEGIIKIWDMKMAFKNIQSLQQFIGHSSGIKSLVLIENKSLLISVSENSGILFWNFLGDVTFTETEITQELDRLGDVNQMREAMKTTNRNRFGKTTTLSSVSGFYNPQKAKSKQSDTTSQIRIKHMEKVYKMENSANENKSKESELNAKGQKDQSEQKGKNVLTMLPTSYEIDGIDVSYSNSDFNITQDVLEKYYEGTMTVEDIEKIMLFNIKRIPIKIENFVEPKASSDKLNIQYCLGMSIDSMENIVYSQRDKWYAFTVNNKIVIEFLQQERSELILKDSKDVLSCLTLSPSEKFLISAVGCANREEYAAIFVYDTEAFRLIKKLNFHFKGVQRVKVGDNERYMVSIGSKEEKSICVWNFTNLTVIDSKSVKFPIIDIVIESPRVNDMFLYFVSISINVLSFWRMNNTFQLESFHIKDNDLITERDKDDYFTSIALTQYFTSIQTSFVILGTSKGNIYIIEKEKKNVIRKHIICKFPITHILYYQTKFLCCGEGPLIFLWEYDPKQISTSNVFSFLKEKKPILFAIDGAVRAVKVSAQQSEALLCTEMGSMFFVDFNERKAIKILSSHMNCEILSLETDLSNNNLFSCGRDETLRCWTTDSFDMKYRIYKENQIPFKCMINMKENVLIVQYGDKDNEEEIGYLRLYDMQTLKSLGVINLKDNAICNFSLILNDMGIILMTHQGHMYIIDVQNWRPLNVLYSLLEPSTNVAPLNQICKSLSTKDITSEKGYAIVSYSDGTVNSFYIEKNNGAIDITTIDTFNIIEYHMGKVEDVNVKELYANLTKCRCDYKTQVEFSRHLNGIALCFHEYIQFIYVRNYEKNEVIKCVPLNYFPFCFTMSEDEKVIAIGTKEGIVIIVTLNGETYMSGYSMEVFPGHYDTVNVVKFSRDLLKLYSSSDSEMFVWDVRK